MAAAATVAAALPTPRSRWRAFVAVALVATVLLSVAFAITGKLAVSQVPVTVSDVLPDALVDTASHVLAEAGQAVVEAGRDIALAGKAAASAMLNMVGPDVPFVPMTWERPQPVWHVADDSTLGFVLEGDPTLPMPVEVSLDTGVQPGTHIGVNGRIGGSIVLGIMSFRGDVNFYLSFIRGESSHAWFHKDGQWQKQELPYPPAFEAEDPWAYVEFRVSDQTIDVGINSTWYLRVPLSSHNKAQNMGILLLRAYETHAHTLAVTRVEARGLPLTRSIPQPEGLLIPNTARRQPPLDDNSTISLFVGVLSAATNYVQRLAVRNAWFLDPHIVSGKVAVRFFVGNSHDADVAARITEEYRQFGDIIQIQAPEAYLNVGFKTLAMVETMLAYTTATHLLKCDDDTFLRLDRILPYLESNGQPPVYMGFISNAGVTNRDPTNRYFISRAVFPSEVTPAFAHGPAYIISRDLAEHITHGIASGDLHVLPLEDVAMASWVDHAKSSGMPVRYVSSPRFLLAGCKDLSYNAHYVNPDRMLCMWNLTIANDPHWCC